MALYNLFISHTHKLFRKGTKNVPWSVVSEWLSKHPGYYAKKAGPTMTAVGIYCDSGKPGKSAIRIRVCDKDGKDLLGKVANAKYKGHKVWRDKKNKFTNNMGELFAVTVAMKVAVEKGIKKVFTDSSVATYWIQGKGKALKENANLAWYYKNYTKATYEAFKNLNGYVMKIKGCENVADLGDHRD